MIIFDLRDPRLALISVTRVQISSDLRHADVSISSLEEDATRPEALAALRHASGLLRRELGKRTTLRYVPETRGASLEDIEAHLTAGRPFAAFGRA